VHDIGAWRRRCGRLEAAAAEHANTNHAYEQKQRTAQSKADAFALSLLRLIGIEIIQRRSWW